MNKTEKTSALLDRRDAAIPRGPKSVTPIFIDHAKGSEVWDIDGNRYLDFAGGIGVLNVGHTPKPVVDAIQKQAEKLIHSCFTVAMYEPYIELAEELNQLTPGDFPKKTIFFNSGAEAVENAIKIARYATGRPAIICFDHAFHGRTLLTMSLTSKVKPYKYGFGPFAPELYRIPYSNCYRCPYNMEFPSCDVHCGHALESIFKTHVAADKVAAVIVEPVLGEGGFISPPPEFLQVMKKICEKENIIFIVDEVQSGFGRTGKFFASEHMSIEPDLIVMAKSLGAGMPISAVTGRAELMDTPEIGGLGGTYGGNPIACSAALATLGMMKEKGFMKHAQELGQIAIDRFIEMKKTYSIIGDVRGLGCMVAIELVRDLKTKEPADTETDELVKLCFNKGLIVLKTSTYNNVLRLLMPLVISNDELNEGLNIIENTFEELFAQ